MKSLSLERFHCDNAGNEGLEWPMLPPFSAFLSLIPTLSVAGILAWRG